MRLVAYRQYTWWLYGHLGRRIRIAIPSCAVSAIRDVYPEADPGTYRGFEEADKDGEDAGYPGITININSVIDPLGCVHIQHSVMDA